jgi:hypothetical protein
MIAAVLCWGGVNGDCAKVRRVPAFILPYKSKLGSGTLWMLHRSVVFSLLTLLTFHTSAARDSDAVGRVNCDTWKRVTVTAYQALGEGPLRLAAIYCHGSGGAYGDEATAVSPDLQYVAYHDEREHKLYAQRLDSFDKATAYPFDLGTFVRLGLRGQPAFRWSEDSRFVWAATQEHMRPMGGWALSPMQPVRLQNGATTLLPAVKHKAGPLDGLLWAGDGKALALLGVRGGYYRPEREDRDPTLAIIDAKSGATLDAMPLGSAPRAQPLVFAVTAIPGGPVRAVIGGKDWKVWTQNEPLRALVIAPPTPNHTRAFLTQDGTRLLVANDIHVWTMCPRALAPGRECVRGPTAEGTLATLYALPSGQQLWTKRIRSESGPGLVVSISADARYALISMPSARRDGARRLALIDMRDGAVVQTLPQPETGPYAVGFAADSRRLWVTANGVTAIYRLR